MLKTAIKYSIAPLMMSVILGCSSSNNSSENPEDNSPEINEVQKAKIVGQVSSDSGAAGINVSVGSISTTTDGNGLFVLNGLALSDTNRWIVEFSKEDYVSTQKIVESNDEQFSYSLNVMMTAPDITKVVDLSQEQTIALNQNQLSITLPSNAVQGGDDNSTVSLTYGDPSSARGKALFPGDYSATNNLADPANIILESIGFMDISITSETGEDLSELNEPAEVTLRLPPIYQLGGEKSSEFVQGDTIAWWSYNEIEGTWLREDADPSTEALDDATIEEIEGVLFAKAKITHFSWWNVDRPIEEHACISVKVVDDLGSPLANQAVFSEGISFQFTDTSLTNNQGVVNLTVKRTLDPESPETFKLYTKLGTAIVQYQVMDSSEGIPSTGRLYSPTESGSTIVGNVATCTELVNDIVAGLEGTINGTVKNSDNTIAANTLVYSSLGNSVLTDAAGNFSFKVPLNSDIYIIIPDQFSNLYTTTNAVKTLNIDIILINQAPAITQIKLTPSSGINSGDTIDISAQATDPEGDNLTYTWSSSYGAFSSLNGQNVNWTAPLESGSGEITLKVTDDKNNETTRSTFISWFDINSVNDDFTVRARTGTNASGNNSIEGITVVLHGVDNTSIEQVRITNENGVANFGQLSRDRVSVTIIEEYIYPDAEEYEGQYEEQYDVQTFIDIENRAIAFEVSDSENYYIDDCYEENTIDAVVRFINIPEGTDVIRADGILESIISPEENTDMTVKVCPDYYNSSDNFSVAMAIDTDISSSTIGYSTSIIGHSQAVYEFNKIGTTVFDLSNTPTEIPIINNLDSPVNVSAFAITENIQLLGFSQPVDEGILKVVDIDVDNFYVNAFSYNSDNRETYSQHWSMEELPDSIIINKPNFELTNIEFNPSDRVFSWAIINNSNEANMISLSLEDYTIQWSIIASASTTSIAIPNLPIAFDLINNSDFNSRDVNIENLQSVDNYDDLIRYYIYDDGDYPTLLDFFNASRITYEIASDLQ